MADNIRYMVCVRCMTYNQSAYIEDSLNGFCIQDTDFPFVCVIVDDASTDGEPEVVKKYLDNNFCVADDEILKQEETDDYFLTFAQHRTNKNCFFAVYYLKYNHWGKKDKVPYYQDLLDNSEFVAICEGDDYWIDPLKLQKQVNYLESHPDYSMCFHRAHILKEYECVVGLKCDNIDDREYNANELLEYWKVPTASILERREVLDVKNIMEERILNGDIIQVLNCAKIGKIRGMSDVMSVYRVQNSGVTYDKSMKKYRTLRYPAHFEFIKDNYPFLKSSIINQKIARAYMNRRKIQTNLGAYLKDVLLAFHYNPLVFLDKFKSPR